MITTLQFSLKTTLNLCQAPLTLLHSDSRSVLTPVLWTLKYLQFLWKHRVNVFLYVNWWNKKLMKIKLNYSFSSTSLVFSCLFSSTFYTLPCKMIIESVMFHYLFIESSRKQKKMKIIFLHKNLWMNFLTLHFSSSPYQQQSPGCTHNYLFCRGMHFLLLSVVSSVLVLSCHPRRIEIRNIPLHEV